MGRCNLIGSSNSKYTSADETSTGVLTMSPQRMDQSFVWSVQPRFTGSIKSAQSQQSNFEASKNAQNGTTVQTGRRKHNKQKTLCFS